MQKATFKDANAQNSELEKFLKNNFRFPSDNSNDVGNFIAQDQKLVDIIYDLPKIISKEFPQCPILIDFMKYTLSKETVLEISIMTPFNGEMSSAKKDLILDEIFKKHDRTQKEYFISMEF